MELCWIPFKVGTSLPFIIPSRNETPQHIILINRLLENYDFGRKMYVLPNPEEHIFIRRLPILPISRSLGIQPETIIMDNVEFDEEFDISSVQCKILEIRTPRGLLRFVGVNTTIKELILIKCNELHHFESGIFRGLERLTLKKCIIQNTIINSPTLNTLILMKSVFVNPITYSNLGTIYMDVRVKLDEKSFEKIFTDRLAYFIAKNPVRGYMQYVEGENGAIEEFQSYHNIALRWDDWSQEKETISSKVAAFQRKVIIQYSRDNKGSIYDFDQLFDLYYHDMKVSANEYSRNTQEESNDLCGVQ